MDRTYRFVLTDFRKISSQREGAHFASEMRCWLISFTWYAIGRIKAPSAAWGSSNCLGICSTASAWEDFSLSSQCPLDSALSHPHINIKLSIAPQTHLQYTPATKMSDDTTDLIIQLTIVGILFIVLIVAMTLISLKGWRNCKRKSADIEVPNNIITMELALVSDESSLTPVVQTPKPNVTRIWTGSMRLYYRA